MRTTRSATRLARVDVEAETGENNAESELQQENQTLKRKVTSTPRGNATKKMKSKNEAVPEDSDLFQPTGSSDLNVAANSTTSTANTVGESFVPAVLTFDFKHAKRHLIQVDPRFEGLFNNMSCRPFEQLEQVHPFRALATSILSQQISWLAARSITHRFIRLYNPLVPEKCNEENKSATMALFPTPSQVATTDIAVLKTAGLSARKAEYIQDLAARFADGRLSTEKLINATDEELAEMLIQVRGIGKWTVDMFAIFSLRRPDILPVGDLGIQRGLVRWFLSLHSPSHPFGISPDKVEGASGQQQQNKVPKAKHLGKGNDVLPSIMDGTAVISSEDDAMVPLVQSVNDVQTSPLPPPTTPSIQRTFRKPFDQPVTLPDGITTTMLKSRLDGKKIKGAFLTPQEMTDLTDSWRPFRSLGVYYMWSLASIRAELTPAVTV